MQFTVFCSPVQPHYARTNAGAGLHLLVSLRSLSAVGAPSHGVEIDGSFANHVIPRCHSQPSCRGGTCSDTMERQDMTEYRIGHALIRITLYVVVVANIILRTYLHIYLPYYVRLSSPITAVLLYTTVVVLCEPPLTNIYCRQRRGGGWRAYFEVFAPFISFMRLLFRLIYSAYSETIIVVFLDDIIRCCDYELHHNRIYH